MNQNNNNYDYMIKLVLIGDANVGKSSLVFRCVDKTYTDRYLSTIGLDYKIKRITLDGKHIKICIWDTAGQEKFRAITAGYYRDAHGIIVAYDITNQKSFNNVKIWMNEIRKRANKNVNVLLVGNKCDLTDEREVFYETGKNFADEMGVPFLETSAKDAINVELAIYTMAKEIKAKLVKETTDKAKATKLKKSRDSDLNCCSIS